VPELSGVVQLMQAMNKAPNVSRLFGLTLDHLVTTLGEAAGAILLVEPLSGDYYLADSRGLTAEQSAGLSRLHSVFLEQPELRAALEAGALWGTSDPLKMRGLPAGFKQPARPIFILPLAVEENVLGILMVAANIGMEDEEARAWLQTVASLMACAAYRLRQSEAAHMHRLLLETVRMLDQDMVVHPKVDEILPRAARLICEKFSLNCVAIYLAGDDNYTLYRSSQEAQGIVSEQGCVNREEIPLPIVLQALERQAPATASRVAPAQADSLTHIYTEIAVPIVLREQTIGALYAVSSRVDGLNVDRQVAAAVLAGQMSMAVSNTHLLGDREQRIAELAAMTDLGHAINSVLDEQKVSQLILDSAMRLIEADDAALFVNKNDALTPAATLNRVGRDQGGVEIFDAQQARAVAESSRPVSAAAADQQGYHTISFPLTVKGQTIGVIQLLRAGADRAFDADDQRLLASLALPSSTALENALLYEEAQRRLAEVSTLYTLAQRMTSSLDLNQMLDSLVVVLRRVINCRGCCIFLLDESSGLLEIRAASGLKPEWQEQAKLRIGEGVSGRVVKEERAIYIPDVRAMPDYIAFDPEVRSLLAVPLITKGRVIGALNVDDDKPNAFDAHEGQLLTIAAAQAATMIENARLYESLKERARRLKLAYDELKELNRLKSEFVQNVSHELRTPLTFIRGYVELLLDGALGEMTERQTEAMRVVAAKTQTLTRLVNDVISLQKAEMTTLDLTPVSLTDVIDLALRGAEVAAHEAGLTLIRNVPPDLPPVLGDRARLGQILDNLLGNALKFTPPGGTVEVRLEDAGDFERVSVLDSGIGIPADKFEKVFEPFYQIDGSSTRHAGGAGLGLAIVKQIVEAHGGQVGLVSHVDEGSNFSFTIPKYALHRPYTTTADRPDYPNDG